jgi:hypothetical protein
MLWREPRSPRTARFKPPRTYHIPPDFVADGAPQRVKAAHVMISRCSTPWGRQTNCKITPTISRAWHFTTQSGGVYDFFLMHKEATACRMIKRFF